MPTDTRAQAAKYDDLSPDTPADIPFSRRLIPSPEARLLELGCGTGRVLVSLAEGCGYMHGLDLSEAMVAICHRKLEAAGIAATKAQVEVKDITKSCATEPRNGCRRDRPVPMCTATPDAWGKLSLACVLS